MVNKTGTLIRFLKCLPVVLAVAAEANEDILSLSLTELAEEEIFSSTIWDSHIHAKGEWMIGYHYMKMSMDGMGRGDSKVSTANVLADFMVTPTKMTMDMHMVHVMYAPTESLTLALATQYIKNEMDHRTRMGAVFSTQSEGIGDTTIAANYLLPSTSDAVMMVNAGLVLPTGSINKKDFVAPAGVVQVLPYPMQLGTGSYQLQGGFTYMATAGNNGYGVNGQLKVPMDTNSEGYRVGAQAHLESWYHVPLHDQLSANLGLAYDWQEKIHGKDDRLFPMVVPTADTDNSGGQSLNATFSTEYTLPQSENGVTVFATAPLWQDLNGVQLRDEWSVGISLKVLFQ